MRLVDEVTLNNRNAANLGTLVDNIRKGRDGTSVQQLDILSVETLKKFSPYQKYDNQITDALKKYLEKTFVQDVHLEALKQSGDLDEKSDSHKGICFGHVVTWVLHQINAEGNQKNTSGIKTLEKESLNAKKIQDDHVGYSKNYIQRDSLQQNLIKQDATLTDLERKKNIKAALIQKQIVNNAILMKDEDFTVKNSTLTLQKYGLALSFDEVRSNNTNQLVGARENRLMEEIEYKYNNIGFPELINSILKLTAPTFFILSIKWMGSNEKGGHVWAGSIRQSGLRMFDPNMGTFFTNSNRGDLLQAMYDKWERDDRHITGYTYLPVKKIDI